MFLPLVTRSRRSVIALERSFHHCVNGVMSTLSATNSATTAAAAIIRSCWRFLIFTSPSFVPAEIECELQRRFVSSCGWPVQFADFPTVAQVCPNREQGRAVPAEARATERIVVAGF